MHVVLLATYEMGRQPFGLASPAAWLRQAGASVVCQDLSRSRLDQEEIVAADLVALYIPMHTATRIAAHVGQHIKALKPQVHLCFYGLYAPMNAAFLRSLGADTILGGEFESGLLHLVQRLPTQTVAPALQPEPLISLERQHFLVPDRQDLPPLHTYTRLVTGPATTRLVGYTEASRGCKHTCRHCPVVPVYAGHFRVVQRPIVLADIRQQVAVGAEHITFGDPDFFNGIGHALPLVQDLHQEFPELSYDVTIKIEHLLRYAKHLPVLRDTGCLFITSAVEAVQDATLAILDKGHTREDFFQALALCRQLDLPLNPTFVAFMPWVSLEDYIDLLTVLAQQALIDQVAPIQLAMRLLLPAGSPLLEVPEMQPMRHDFDATALTYRWEHPDPRMEHLNAEVLTLVQQGEAQEASRRDVFMRLWSAAHQAANLPTPTLPPPVVAPPRRPIPFLDEPWYC